MSSFGGGWCKKNKAAGGALGMLAFFCLVETFKDDIIKRIWIGGIFSCVATLILIGLKALDAAYSSRALAGCASFGIGCVGAVGYWVCLNKKEDLHQMRAQQKLEEITKKWEQKQKELEGALIGMKSADADIKKIQQDVKEKFAQVQAEVGRLTKFFEDMIDEEYHGEFYKYLFKHVNKFDEAHKESRNQLKAILANMAYDPQAPTSELPEEIAGVIDDCTLETEIMFKELMRLHTWQLIVDGRRQWDQWNAVQVHAPASSPAP